MSYQEPAGEPAREEARRRQAAEAAEREDTYASRGEGARYDEPYVRPLGSGGGGVGGGGGAPSPVPTPPAERLRFLSAAINDAFDEITLTFSRAVDLTSASLPGRFLIYRLVEIPNPLGGSSITRTQVTAAQTVTTPGETVVISLATPIPAAHTYEITIRELTSDLAAYGDADTLLTGTRMRTFVTSTSVAPLAVTTATHNPEYTEVTLTFNRELDSGSNTARQFRLSWPPSGGGDGPPVTRVATGELVAGRTLTLTSPAALPADTTVTVRAAQYGPPQGLRDTLQPANYLAAHEEYVFEFDTDPIDPFGLVGEATYVNNRVVVTFTNPLRRGSVVQTDSGTDNAMDVFVDESGAQVPMHATDRISISGDSTMLSWAPAQPLGRGARYRVTFGSGLRDRFGQSLPDSLVSHFETSVDFFIEEGSVSAEVHAAGTRIEFEPNRPVNSDTLQDPDTMQWRVEVRRIGGRTLVYRPRNVSVSSDRTVLTANLSQVLSSSSAWSVQLVGDVEDSDGNAYNGVPREFSLGAEFVMTLAPRLYGNNRSYYEFQMSHRPADHNGNPASVLAAHQVQVVWLTAGGARLRTVPNGRGGHDELYNSAPRFSNGTWRLQLSAAGVSVINGSNPNGTGPVYLRIVDRMPGEDGHLFAGGARGRRNNGWWEWLLHGPTLPPTTELRALSATMPAANEVRIRFDDDVGISVQSSFTFGVLGPSPIPTVTSVLRDPNDHETVILTISRNLVGGESLRITIPSGIPSSDATAFTRRTQVNATYHRTREFFFVTTKGYSARSKIAYFRLTKPVSTASHRSHIRTTGGLRVRATQVIVLTGRVNYTNLEVSFVEPVRPGTYTVTVHTTLRSTDGSYLSGTPAARSITFTVDAPPEDALVRNREKDRFVRGSTSITLGYDGTIPTRTTGGLGVEDIDQWTITAHDKATPQQRAREERSVRVRRAQIVQGTGITLTVSAPPRYSAQWTIRGPRVQTHNGPFSLGTGSLTT